ncbi:MAG TPA: signal recognition particle-docking protein FtsY [Bacteroidia bacterium]|nr:signal recognition particle-docking protein FtsY [Bacteroidia bacterium]
MGLLSFLTGEKKERLDQGLSKTRESFFLKLTRIISGKPKIDDEVLADLEETLISSDVGVTTTLKIIERLKKRVAEEKNAETSRLIEILKEEIVALLGSDNQLESEKNISSHPYVIMIVGVNGVGKTTTIGKLAYNFREDGKKIILGAADTFRAAAIEQLKIWAERSGAEIISQQMGADPASVAFDTVKSAVAQKADIVMIDTAGRLHNKVNLMNELSKVRRVMEKVVAGAPHEVLLVLDASTGQNAIEQARQFMKATHVTGIVLTKLDGTAKGGVVLAIADEFKIPVKYIGVGEKIDDLQVFSKSDFVDSLFNENK